MKINAGRRSFTYLVVSLILPGAFWGGYCPPASAQQLNEPRRIGLLVASRPGDKRVDGFIESFEQTLRASSFEGARNVVIERHSADGKEERFAHLASELVRGKVDIIVTMTDAGARAAAKATKTIPIVFISGGVDPVEAGLVKSLSHPGGNITGVAQRAVEMAGKRLELLRDAISKASRIAVLYDPGNRGNTIEALEALPAAGRSLGLRIQPWEVRNATDIDNIFASVDRDRPDGIFLPGGPLLNSNDKRVANLALKNKLPSIFVFPEQAENGGLMAYGPNYANAGRDMAQYVIRILQGAKPAELPVIQPTKFELVINLKTAKQIGLIVPQSVLYRADRVIR